ncbi:MATE family efflux transporter [Nocardioides fonticola]|uniref:MATE family efflux transporter n=1 Tax=Nocardioides fonticola TaxID=450363 RepID=A0ABP7XS32_9ACTN
MRTPAQRELDRAIARLAVPAFLTLITEPLLLLGDAAIVGHLGTRELAALGLAGAVVQTVIGLCIFLAYGTTARVARLLGADGRREAIAQGVDGLALAVVIGVPVTLGVALAARPLVDLFGAGEEVATEAAAYLRVAALGVTPLLVMLAATGVLRGLQDTRTPLVVAVGGNLANLALNAVLVYPAGLGLQGSALGSVIAQVLMAAALTVAVARGARSAGARLRPRASGVALIARAGLPLIVRTLTLRAALLLTTYAVTLGATGRALEVDLATHQLATTVWSLLAFVLDALAIAAQALTGRSLGAGDVAEVRAITRRLLGWSVVVGVVTGVAVALASPVLGVPFTDDTAVRDRLVPVLLVAAVGQLLAGPVFLLDGVLIGAGDGRYLAIAGVVVGLVYAPLVLLAGPHGLVAVWSVFVVVLMGGRALTLFQRARGGAWMVTGT